MTANNDFMSFFNDVNMRVIQLHPKKSQYVNITDALHLWRPADGDWARMNGGILGEV